MNKVNTSVLAVLILGSLGTGLGLLTHRHTFQAEAAAVQKKTDKDYIIGTWRLTKARKEGKDVKSNLDSLVRIVFAKDGKVIFQLGEDAKEGQYKLPAAGQIDLALGQPDLRPGIYKFDGEHRLTICFATGRDDKRPTDFSSERGSSQGLLVLQRAKPGEEKLTPQELAKVQEATARTERVNNLKQLGLTIHNFAGVYNNRLPAHAIYKDGKPLLSWRVAILPFIEQVELYKKFRRDEPWDSPHNIKLLPLMPKVFAPVGVKTKEPHTTFIQAIVGPEAGWQPPKKTLTSPNGVGDMKLPGSIPAGTSKVIALVETSPAVPWTKPEDVAYDAKKAVPKLGGVHKDGFYAVFFDAHWEFIMEISDDNLRILLNPSSTKAVGKYKSN